MVYPPPMNRLRAVLDASAVVHQLRHRIPARSQDRREDFEVTPQVLDRVPGLRCRTGSIQPGVGEWSAERDFVTNRLKTEIFNQAFGVEKGDEVEAQRDPVILKALEVLGL